jgi:hypothetical protein
MTAKTLQNHSIRQTQCLYTAFELGHKEWKLAFGIGGKNSRIVSVSARNVEDLNTEIEKAKSKFKLTPDCLVFSCYEAALAELAPKSREAMHALRILAQHKGDKGAPARAELSRLLATNKSAQE